MSGCVVCGAPPMSPTSSTCSWRCAGIYSHQRKQERIVAKRDELRLLYGNPAKAEARSKMLDDVRALPTGARVLDLYGGGLSAEWFLAERPDINLVVVERDKSLWPAMDLDAKRLDFAPVYGDVSLATGPFDFAYLDLCSEPMGAYEAVTRTIPLLSNWWQKKYGKPVTHDCLYVKPDLDPAALYVTVLRQNRHGYSELKQRGFDIAMKALFDDACNTPLTVTERIFAYRQASGRGLVELWRIGASYVMQAKLLSDYNRAFDEGAAFHRHEVASWYKSADEGSYYNDSRRPHAEGTCRCPDKGYISRDEMRGDNDRFVAWRRVWDAAA